MPSFDSASHPRQPGPLHTLGLDVIEGVTELDAAVRLAADVAQTPFALLASTEETDVRVLARHGRALPGALANALCGAALALDQPLVVADLLLDARFAEPARADSGARSAVAMALREPGQPSAAVLCVLDRRVRDFDAGRLAALADVAALARLWFVARRATLGARDERASSQALILNLGDALRPQLDILIGHSQVLLLEPDAVLAPRVQRHLEKLRHAAQRAGKLFDDLPRLIRAQAGDAVSSNDFARSRGVDLDVLARHAIALHETQARDCGVRLRHIAWPEPVFADADLSAVLQVISELLANGIVFNLRDATLTLETSVRDGRACLSFTDEGLGMDEAQQARLFNPLGRAPAAEATRDADGLGLVIARAMACAMGGNIRVQSRPGAGSTFTLDLPLQRRPATLAAAPTSTRPALDEST